MDSLNKKMKRKKNPNGLFQPKLALGLRSKTRCDLKRKIPNRLILRLSIDKKTEMGPSKEKLTKQNQKSLRVKKRARTMNAVPRSALTSKRC